MYSGVITTMRKATAGVGTPWDREQSSAYAEVEDALNRQTRSIRVEFEPAGGAKGSAGDVTGELNDAARRDLRAFAGPLVMRVTAALYRVQRPQWRVEPTAINLSTRAQDGALSRRGLAGEYSTMIADDRELAARVVAQVRERVRMGRADGTTEETGGK